MIKALVIISLAAIAGCSTRDNLGQMSSATNNTKSPKILVVLSSSSYVTTKEGHRHPTGYFLSELAGPAIALKQSGYELVFATPGGKIPVADPTSIQQQWFKTLETYSAARQFAANESGLKHPLALETLKAQDLETFAGIFIPGGHAPVEDLSRNKSLGDVLKYFHEHHKPTGLICHGPAALLSAPVEHGKWLYSAYALTGFSTAEEKQEEDNGHLDGHMPFYLDAELSRLGGNVSTANPWQSHAVRDRELITGQNPMSEEEFTALFLESLTVARFSTSSTENFINTIASNVLYKIDHSAPGSSWSDGHNTLWIGRRDGVRSSFLTKLTSHVVATWNTFKNQGLTGYLVYATPDYEIAFLRWTGKDAADKAFASSAGKQIATDAATFMKPVLFKEIAVSLGRAASLNYLKCLDKKDGTDHTVEISAQRKGTYNVTFTRDLDVPGGAFSRDTYAAIGDVSKQAIRLTLWQDGTSIAAIDGTPNEFELFGIHFACSSR